MLRGELFFVDIQPLPCFRSLAVAIEEDLAQVLRFVIIYLIFVPRMLLDFFDAWTAFTDVTEDLLHQELELCREVGRLQGFPVLGIDAFFVALSRQEETVELVLDRGFAKGEVPDDEGEQNDAHGENVCFSAIVHVTVANFGCHVALGSSEGRQCVDIAIS